METPPADAPGPKIAVDICEKMFSTMMECVNNYRREYEFELDDLKSRVVRMKTAAKRKLDQNSEEHTSKKKRPSQEVAVGKELKVLQGKNDTSTPNEKKPFEIRFSADLTKIDNERPSKRQASIKADLMTNKMVNMNLSKKIRRPDKENTPVIQEIILENDKIQDSNIMPETEAIVPELDTKNSKPDETVPDMPPPPPPKRKRKNNNKYSVVNEGDSENEVTIDRSTRTLRARTMAAKPYETRRVTRATAARVTLTVGNNEKTINIVQESLVEKTLSKTSSVDDSDSSIEAPTKKKGRKPKLAKTKTVSTEDEETSKTALPASMETTQKNKGRKPRLAKTKTVSTEDETEKVASTVTDTVPNTDDCVKDVKKGRKLKSDKGSTQSTEDETEITTSTITVAVPEPECPLKDASQIKKSKKKTQMKESTTSTEDEPEAPSTVETEAPSEETNKPKRGRKQKVVKTRSQSIESEKAEKDIDAKPPSETDTNIIPSSEIINSGNTTVVLDSQEKLQTDTEKVSESKCLTITKEIEPEITPKAVEVNNLNCTTIISKEVNKILDVTHDVEVKSVKPALDETIVITKSQSNQDTIDSSAYKEYAVNETIVISKQTSVENEENKLSINLSRSLLPDDPSEIEETPPTKVPVTKVTANSKNQTYEESPVKMRVRQFEMMAAKTNLPEATKNDIPKAKRIRMNSQSKIRQIETQGDQSKVVTTKSTPNNARKIPVLAGSTSKKIIPSVDMFSPKAVPSVNLMNVVKDKDDAAAKKELHQKRKIEEQKKKREEKFKAAALAREAQEKEKLDKLKQQQERELEKKKIIMADEERRKQERAQAHALKLAAMAKKTDDKENIKKMAEMKLLANGKILPANHAYDFNVMMKLDEQLEDENARSGERKKRIEQIKPLWAKHIDKSASTNKYFNIRAIDRLYSVQRCSPDLTLIFPGIDKSRVKRTSSAVWKTPPRCSMMPKFN